MRFEPEKGFLHAEARVTLRVNEPTRTIEFELNRHLKILEVNDAQGRKLEFVRSGRLGSHKLSVRLAEPITAIRDATAEAGAGDAPEIALTFVYEGALPASPLDYVTKDGILLRDESRWYPATDLSVFAPNDVGITLPDGWVAFTSGEPHGLHEPQKQVRWVTARPISSRSLVAAPWFRWQCHLTRVVQACARPEWSRPASGNYALAERVEAIFFAGIGPFALPKESKQPFTIVQGFPGQRGAVGYSAPGFLVVSEDVVRWHDYPGYAPELLPHEMAHQWFPIEVTLEREEDGWLAESLAEYLAWRYLQEKDPAAARTMAARAMRDSPIPSPGEERLRPLSLGLHLFGEGNDLAHTVLYQRGMLVWRTLETVIGRSRVDRALREYYARYKGRSASIADFRKICEEISGRELGWFFDYYIHGTEIPEITIRRVASAAPNEYAGEIVVHNAPPEYQVRVEMRLETPNGVVDHSVATNGEVTPFTVTVPGRVTRVVVDPDSRTLRWTEAARRHRAQRDLLIEAGELERNGDLAAAHQQVQEALAADSENLAANEQLIRFTLARLDDRLGKGTAAFAEFGRVLALHSLDPMETDFYRVWARVYRARIEKPRGRPAAARAEAEVGLAMKSPALETPVAWPEAPVRETTALAELKKLAK